MDKELKKRTMEKLVSIVDRVSYLLSEKKINQKSLASAMGVSEAYVSDILNYKKQNFGLETIVKLEMALGSDIVVNPDDFEEMLTQDIQRLAKLMQIANEIKAESKPNTTAYVVANADYIRRSNRKFIPNVAYVSPVEKVGADIS